ncbi:hypothetical protein IQ07DRAFT_137093 [Pyrenochaeta sp. DS3sAY3a]|nr:hypothetical protein IQ07DRAFT_137093 [Pyrenochaeta sp. DS3sAY3a]
MDACGQRVWICSTPSLQVFKSPRRRWLAVARCCEVADALERRVMRKVGRTAQARELTTTGWRG